MASSVTITLDTTVPGGVTVTAEGGAAQTTDLDIDLAIACSDGDTTGYSMKIYGNVDDAFDTANYRAAEANAPWISFSTTKSVRVSTGDGTKTIRVKVRDTVGNASTEATDTITLNTAVPVVTVTAGPTAAKISKVATFDSSQFTWQSDLGFDEYKVKVVASSSDAHTSGVQVPTTAGSGNVAGTATGYPAATGIVTTIKGADLETASAGDGAKIVKVFVKDATGAWSI